MENKLKELYDSMAEKAGDVIAAMNAGKSEDDVKALKKLVTTELEKYNREAARVFIAERIAEGSNPVEAVARKLYIPEAKRVSYKKNNKTGVRFLEITTDAEARFDPFHLESVAGVEKFHDPKWFDEKVSALALLIANATNDDLDRNIGFVYAVSDAAKVFSFGPDADPKSTASMTKALQQTVDSILYIPTANANGETVNSLKVRTQAWKFIEKAMTKRTRTPGEIGVYDPTIACDLVFEIIHVLLNNGTFKVVSA